jgi:hypothetical protein
VLRDWIQTIGNPNRQRIPRRSSCPKKCSSARIAVELPSSSLAALAARLDQLAHATASTQARPRTARDKLRRLNAARVAMPWQPVRHHADPNCVGVSDRSELGALQRWCHRLLATIRPVNQRTAQVKVPPLTRGSKVRYCHGENPR